MKNSFQSRLGTLAFALMTMTAAALTPSCTHSTGENEEAGVGSVSLALTATTGGTTYRLTGATFEIEGPVNTVLSSVGDPSVTVLTTELATGNYLSTLQGGWVLERFNGVAYVPVEAALVSGNPANFSILDGEVTSLVYEFNTDGTIISMGTGFLSVSIQVNEETTSGSCTPFGPECGAGTWCAPGRLFGLPEEGVCLAFGSLPNGSDCSDPVDACAENNVCAEVGGPTAECIELCRLEQIGQACSNGVICNGSLSPEVGVCL